MFSYQYSEIDESRRLQPHQRILSKGACWEARTEFVYPEPPERACGPCLSGAISWLTLITQIRSRMTTTRSSRTPSSPQREGSVSKGLSVSVRGSREGEDIDIIAPTQHRATLKTNSHTRPPMVPSPRNSNCRSRGASHRYSLTWRACTDQKEVQEVSFNLTITRKLPRHSS